MVRKLVRDKVPDLLEQDHEVRKHGTFTEKKDYRKALFEKLLEEAKEARREYRDRPESYGSADLAEELGDILETIEAIEEEFDLHSNMVLHAQRKKRHRKGTFSRRAWVEFD